jgi:hypothetical protein
MRSQPAPQPLPESKQKQQRSAISAVEAAKRAGIPARFLFLSSLLVALIFNLLGELARFTIKLR